MWSLLAGLTSILHPLPDLLWQSHPGVGCSLSLGSEDRIPPVSGELHLLAPKQGPWAAQINRKGLAWMSGDRAPSWPRGGPQTPGSSQRVLPIG